MWSLASGVLGAFIAMIHKADGDYTPLGQRPLSVLPVVYRLWASLRLGHLREWVEGWLLKSVFSLGNGLSSVEAWFSTALDTEEVLSGIGGDQLHVMVSDVIKSFDTVDRSILDCALGRLGLPDRFWRGLSRSHFRKIGGKGRHDCMKLCVVRRESGPTKVPRSTLANVTKFLSKAYVTGCGVFCGPHQRRRRRHPVAGPRRRHLARVLPGLHPWRRRACEQPRLWVQL